MCLLIEVMCPSWNPCLVCIAKIGRSVSTLCHLNLLITIEQLSLSERLFHQAQHITIIVILPLEPM